MDRVTGVATVGMKTMRFLTLGTLTLASLPCISGLGFAQTASLSIDTAASVATVSPTLYGLMTEEINYSYDGGLYAEIVRNRTFDKSWSGFEHWTVLQQGDAHVAISKGETGPSASLAKSIQLTLARNSVKAEAGIANPGYWGMAVRPATLYNGSFYAKTEGISTAHLRLVSNVTGAVLAETTVGLHAGDWQQYEYALKTGATLKVGEENHLQILFAQPGKVWLQLVSLFPPTFHDRPNGNRTDLMQMMAAMHPNFLRLPGGNYLEGDTIEERFDWKKTIGPLVDRPTHRSPWNYQSTDGMGLLEYLEWCEDLNVKPVLAVYAGYSLKGEHVTGRELEPFIQDALDEIQYVTGDTSTKWGAERAKDGHPAAFALDYIEIGNEDTFDKSGSYEERFSRYAKAIRGAYPQYKLIATKRVKEGDPDVIDDHYYQTANEFFDMVHKYDTMDRNGPKIFVGEWATRMGSPTPNFGAALGDAAWMTSMERNSDLIVMASYAPLFTNVNPGGMQWTSDLIGYDAQHAYGSPSYWAQVLFAQHLGDHTVDSTAAGLNPRFFWSATVSTKAKMLHLKLVNASDRPQSLTLHIAGAVRGAATVSTLHAPTWFATNSITHPDTVRPVQSKVAVKAALWRHEIPGNTIEVMDVPLK